MPIVCAKDSGRMRFDDKTMDSVCEVCGHSMSLLQLHELRRVISMENKVYSKENTAKLEEMMRGIGLKSI